MLTAVFENEPDASAAAIQLRENGFDARVIVAGSDTFDQRTKDFFQGKTAPFVPHAVLVSEDADSERFLRTVQRHFGLILSADV